MNLLVIISANWFHTRKTSRYGCLDYHTRTWLLMCKSQKLRIYIIENPLSWD